MILAKLQKYVSPASPQTAHVNMLKGAMVSLARRAVIARHGHANWTTGLTIPTVARRIHPTWSLFANIITT